VQDVFSRRIIGWSMRDDLKSELVLDALGMAVTVRGGDAAGVVAHSDHGSQDTSLVYGAYAKQSGSISRWARSVTPGTTLWRRASSPALITGLSRKRAMGLEPTTLSLGS
jgi:transposase InsO family protein